MLQKADISGHQARSDEAKHLPEGEIPRHDRQNHTERLVSNETFLCRRFDDLVGQESLCVFRVIAAHPGALGGLGHGRLERLPHFRGHQPPKRCFFGFENLARPAHHPPAFGE